MAASKAARSSSPWFCCSGDDVLSKTDFASIAKIVRGTSYLGFSRRDDFCDCCSISWICDCCSISWMWGCKRPGTIDSSLQVRHASPNCSGTTPNSSVGFHLSTNLNLSTCLGWFLMNSLDSSSDSMRMAPESSRDLSSYSLSCTKKLAASLTQLPKFNLAWWHCRLGKVVDASAIGSKVSSQSSDPSCNMLVVNPAASGSPRSCDVPFEAMKQLILRGLGKEASLKRCQAPLKQRSKHGL